MLKSGEGANPEALVRQLTSEAETVAKARQALGDLPPVAGAATGSVVLL